MDWSNERYVRLYVRDTVDEAMWPWQAHAIWPHIVKRADRSGVIDIGKHKPVKAVAALIRFPVEVCEVGLAALFEDECLMLSGSQLVVRNYIPAQEAVMSDAQRQRESRAKKAIERAGVGVTPRDNESQIVTPRDNASRDVTTSHGESLRAVPSVPSDPSEIAHAHTRGTRANDVDDPHSEDYPQSEANAPYLAVREFAAALPTHSMHDFQKWREDWAWIGLQPAAERAVVIATMAASARVHKFWRRCNPGHVRRHWQVYAAGEEPGQQWAANDNGRHLTGPSEVSKPEDFEETTL